MRLLLLFALILIAAAPASAAERTIGQLHTPTRERYGQTLTAFPVIDAYGGRVVWSDYDAAIDAWRLMEHVGGAVHPVPVAPRSTPFDVDLGPDGHGGTLAVYSRCRRTVPFDLPAPDPTTGGASGCDLYAYSFGWARETPVRRANSGADETWPAVWGSRIAFRRGSRVYWRLRRARGPLHRVRRPSSLVASRICTRAGCRTKRAHLPFAITGLDMRGARIAYTYERHADDAVEDFVYLASTGGGLRAMSKGTSTGGGAATSMQRMGEPALGRDRLDWRFWNEDEPAFFAAFLRHKGGLRASSRTKAAAFAQGGATSYWIDAGPGATAYATRQPGGTFAVKADDGLAYGGLPRSWLTVRPPPRG